MLLSSSDLSCIDGMNVVMVQLVCSIEGVSASGLLRPLSGVPRNLSSIEFTGIQSRSIAIQDS